MSNEAGSTGYRDQAEEGAVAGVLLPMSIEILRQACQRFGYCFELLDRHTGYLARVSSAERSFIAGDGCYSHYPINAATSGYLRDKAFTKMVLVDAGFTVLDGEHFFIGERFKEETRGAKREPGAYDYADAVGYPMFVKPNDAALGFGGSVVFTREELQHQLAWLSAQGFHCVLLEPWLRGFKEYRLVVIEGRVAVSYRRRLPQIHGDDVSTVAELLERANRHMLSQTRFDPADPIIRRQLDERGLTSSSVLNSDQRLLLSGGANLRSGGEIDEISSVHPAHLHAWAAALSKALGVRVFGVDVFTEELTSPVGFRIIEANDRVAFHALWKHGCKEEVMQCWKTVLNSHFGDHARDSANV